MPQIRHRLYPLTFIRNITFLLNVCSVTTTATSSPTLSTTTSIATVLSSASLAPIPLPKTANLSVSCAPQTMFFVPYSYMPTCYPSFGSRLPTQQTTSSIDFHHPPSTNTPPTIFSTATIQHTIICVFSDVFVIRTLSPRPTQIGTTIHTPQAQGIQMHGPPHSPRLPHP